MKIPRVPLSDAKSSKSWLHRHPIMALSALAAVAAVLIAVNRPSSAPDALLAKANTSQQTPGYEPNSVPAELRSLEGKLAVIKIPGSESPLLSARGAVMHGSVQAEVVTAANTSDIPMPLASLEQQMDRLVLGYITDDDLVSSMHELSQRADFVLLKDGTPVRIVAPNVNGGFATQLVALSGEWSPKQLDGREVHLWVDSCFIQLADGSGHQLLGHRTSCER